MKTENNIHIRRYAILTVNTIVVVCSFIFHTIFPQDILLFIIILNCCAFIYIYEILKHLHISRTKIHKTNLSNAISQLASDINKQVVSDPTLESVYVELENLRKSLVQKDANRQEALDIVDSIASNIELDSLFDALIPKLMEITGSNCGAFYLANHISTKLEIKCSFGFSKNLYSEFDITLGEGFIGDIAKTKQTKVLTEIPDDTIYVIRTFLGKIKPKSIMVVPILNQGTLVGVLNLASIYEYASNHIEMVEMMKHYMGIAIGNGIAFEKTKRLTNELKFQNKLIQELNSELEKKVQNGTLFMNDIMDKLKDYAIYSLDVNGTIESWNKNAESILGYMTDDIIGKHLEHIYEPEIGKAGKIRAMLESAKREGRFMESGWRTRQDGALYYAETTIFPKYGLNSEIIGFTNVTRDITTFKKSEMSLWFEKEFSAKVMEMSNRPIILINEELVISIANDNAKEYLGNAMPVGTRICQYFDDEQDFRERISKVVQTSVDEEFNCVLKENKKSVKITASLIGDDTNFSKMIFVSTHI